MNCSFVLFDIAQKIPMIKSLLRKPMCCTDFNACDTVFIAYDKNKETNEKYIDPEIEKKYESM